LAIQAYDQMNWRTWKELNTLMLDVCIYGPQHLSSYHCWYFLYTPLLVVNSQLQRFVLSSTVRWMTVSELIVTNVREVRCETRAHHLNCKEAETSVSFVPYKLWQMLQLRGMTRGHNSQGAKNHNFTSTFFDKMHLLSKDLRFEHGGTELTSCPGRHLALLCPCIDCNNKNCFFFSDSDAAA